MQIEGIPVQGTHNFIVGTAKSFAEAGAVVRAFVLNGINALLCTGYAYLFTFKLKYHKGVGLNVIIELVLRFEYFKPVVDA